MTLDQTIEERRKEIERMRELKREMRFLALDAARFEAGRGSKLTEEQFSRRASAARREFKALGLGELDSLVADWISLVK
jgi:hypothetical protein